MTEPRYELRSMTPDGEITTLRTYDTWDDAAEAAKDLGWGEWLTPAEFKLIEGVRIKAVRP